MRPAAFAVLLLAAVAATALPVPAAGDDDTLATRFLLLAGHPAAEAAAGERGVLVIPGLVMPLDGPRTLAASAAAEGQAVAELANRLERTLGLEKIEVLYTHPASLSVKERAALPAPTATSTVRIEVVLEGFNQRVATYRVRFADGRSTFADSLVTVPRGKRALVGGLDGPEAPYLFLVVEPGDTGAAGEGARHLGEGMTAPKALFRPAPQYTPEARKERIQGVVIVQAWIDATGEVRQVKVLKGLPLGLAEAAAEAVGQWRFEPALDRDGNPVDVLYNLTINFRLADETPAGAEKP